MARIVSSINRRSVLAGSAALAALATLPRVLRGQDRSQVLVLGAGLAGLQAALLLQDAGMEVRVIEGSQRVGGRVLSQREVPGNPESGGTSFSPGYARLMSACASHGVETIDLTPIASYFMQRDLYLGGKRIDGAGWASHPRNPFPEPLKKIPPFQYLGAAIGPRNPLATDDAWLAAENAALDMPLDAWLKSQGWNDAMIRMAYDIDPGWGDSAQDVSTLMVLGALRFAQTQRELARGKPMFLTARGGNQAIPEAMANALKNPVEFGRKVVAIEAGRSGVEVRCADGKKYVADHAICSFPATTLRKLKITPALPPVQARAINEIGAQHITMMHVVPRSRFWEQEGATPGMASDGLINMVIAERKSADPEVVTSLTVWLKGRNALQTDKLDRKAAEAAVIAEFEKLRPAARGQLEIIAHHSWQRDEFALGDWAVWHPGQITAFSSEIGKAHGQLHFCGEHTAVSNRGMEGAMESGERAALEVLQSV